MLALSIRQPYVEEIPSTSSGQALRGIKKIEYRPMRTHNIGERFYIYAGLQAAKGRGIARRFAKLGSEKGDIHIHLFHRWSLSHS